MVPASFLLMLAPVLLLLLLLPRRFLMILRLKPKVHIASLHGKHVLITGGSSGIGLAVALECLRQGASLTLVARNPHRLSRAAELLRSSLDPPPPSLEDRILLKAADVSDSMAISAAITESFSWKPIDILVCNAGMTVNAGLFHAMQISDLELITRINFLGCVYTIHAALPLMKARSKHHPCSIVIMSSLAGLLFVYGANIYSATKHALKGLAEVLRFELLSDNIKVSLVCPGFTETPLLDLADELVLKGNKIFFFNRAHAEAAKVVAARTMEGVREGKYLITTSPAGLVTRVLGRGWTPAECLWDALIELLLLVPVRIATHFWFPFAKWMIKKQQEGLN